MSLARGSEEGEGGVGSPGMSLDGAQEVSGGSRGGEPSMPSPRSPSRRGNGEKRVARSPAGRTNGSAKKQRRAVRPDPPSSPPLPSPPRPSLDARLQAIKSQARSLRDSLRDATGLAAAAPPPPLPSLSPDGLENLFAGVQEAYEELVAGMRREGAAGGEDAPPGPKGKAKHSLLSDESGLAHLEYLSRQLFMADLFSDDDLCRAVLQSDAGEWVPKTCVVLYYLRGIALDREVFELAPLLPLAVRSLAQHPLVEVRTAVAKLLDASPQLKVAQGRVSKNRWKVYSNFKAKAKFEVNKLNEGLRPLKLRLDVAVTHEGDAVTHEGGDRPPRIRCSLDVGE